jgi:uncharacterized membrane protein
MAEENESGTSPQMAKIVERNIAALLNRRKEEEARKNREERIADKVTRFTGSMFFVYLHLTLFGIWIIWNLGWDCNRSIRLLWYWPCLLRLKLFSYQHLY